MPEEAVGFPMPAQGAVARFVGAGFGKLARTSSSSSAYVGGTSIAAERST